MFFSQETIVINTDGRGTYDISDKVQSFVSESNITVGLCHVFIQHTSASLMINENVDPSVHGDIEYFLSKWVVDGDVNYRHNYEGDDDMAAHIRTLLTQTELTIPIKEAQLQLGTWQGIYCYEHRYQSHQRYIVITLTGKT